MKAPKGKVQQSSRSCLTCITISFSQQWSKYVVAKNTSKTTREKKIHYASRVFCFCQLRYEDTYSSYTFQIQWCVCELCVLRVSECACVCFCFCVCVCARDRDSSRARERARAREREGIRKRESEGERGRERERATRRDRKSIF
jgi:hypothetical protein